MMGLDDKATPLSMLNRYPHKSPMEHQVQRTVDILIWPCTAICCTASHDIADLAISRT